MGDSIYRKFMIRFNLQDTNDTGLANRLPRPALHQSVNLLICNRHLRGAPGLSPVELATIKAPGTQPYSKPVMDQQLDPVRAFIVSHQTTTGH